jgi:hypothetical protein
MRHYAAIWPIRSERPKRVARDEFVASMDKQINKIAASFSEGGPLG